MRTPEDHKSISTHVKADLHERVRIAAFKRGLTIPQVIEEALRGWVEQQERTTKKSK
ncbi:MAG TPA: hypothetical protein VGY54_16635 [Polyangiaceae bacterium]|jgi:hypothetical protein|nr:hypothetical protein [Polyangiaceae bacterium]